MIDIACHDCIRFGLTHVGTRRDESVRMVEGLLALSFSDSCSLLLPHGLAVAAQAKLAHGFKPDWQSETTHMRHNNMIT